MSLVERSLLNILDNESETLPKRFKVADNAFKSSELLLPHKEAILCKWIMKHSSGSNEKPWKLFSKWLGSNQFKELNRNDIDNEEITNIVQLIEDKIKEESNLMVNSNMTSSATAITCSVMLIENRVFQQYFKYNREVYCQLISTILQNISCISYLEELFKMNLFHKMIIEEEKFHKSFLNIILPTLVDCLKRFNKHSVLFDQISGIAQKCIFYRKHDSYSSFINQFFEDLKVEKHIVPKTFFKHLLQFYSDDIEGSKIKYKLVFHAFCKAYETDFNLLYKFLLLLVHIIGFDMRNSMIFFKVSKLEITETELSLTKSQEILLELLDIICKINTKLDCQVKDVIFSEFLRNVLRQLLFLNTPSDICFKIFIKAIMIDPIVIEPIIDSIIRYAMMVDNIKEKKEYENLILSIIEVYTKLHRIENLVGKLVSSLKDCFDGVTVVIPQMYEFRGQVDVDELTVEVKHFKVEDIFTKQILERFSSCIYNLASWQVINVLKTLLHYLRKHLSSFGTIEKEELMYRYVTYMEILSVLISTVLSSIRIAEHTTASNVVQKSVKELEEMRNLLQQFGVALLHREHNQVLMRSFLNIAYHWAEMYVTLAYYSVNNEVQLTKLLGNDTTPCNITYLHPYLNAKQWCLISERITNFGELPCKLLLKKLYIQKLRAMLLFEKTVNDDLVLNISRNITSNIEKYWREMLCDKFVINNLLPKMDTTSVLIIAECLINNIEDFESLYQQIHISDSSVLLTAINYVTIIKINKLLLKQKRKLNEDTFKSAVSTRICSVFSENLLHEEGHEEVIEKLKGIYSSADERKCEWKINEEKINKLLGILKKFPVIYTSEIIQKVCLLYLCCLHRDFLDEFEKNNYSNLKIACEEMIIGILQHSKFKITDLLELPDFYKEVVNGYTEWEHVFTLITENAFKCGYSIKKYDLVVSEILGNLSNPNKMRSCFVIINSVNKVKRSKMPKEVKAVAEKFKTTICEKIVEAVSTSNPDVNLVIGFSYALKALFSQNDNKSTTLLENLNSYVEFAISDLSNSNSYVPLFITILQNKSKITSLDDEFVCKVWDIYKRNEMTNLDLEEYAQLVVLIFGHIPNERFLTVIEELLSIMFNYITLKNYSQLSKHLKTWEGIISCNLNAAKINILQNTIEQLLQSLTTLLQDSKYDGDLYHNIFHFKTTIIQTSHLHLTPAIIDILILSSTSIMDKEEGDFQDCFNAAISLLDHLLKHRKSLIMDRLPPYLQQYRVIMKNLCHESDSNLNLDDASIRKLSDCAHKIEKLTKNLVSCQKDMSRIAMYLIADILEQYEQITLISNAKIHLNNCIYSLISICDQHAVSYLMRVLSSASTEMFKIVYENYKKYYRFTGKI